MFQMVSNQIFNLYEKKILRIRKIEKEFVGKCDFKDIKCPLKVKDIHKIEKKMSQQNKIHMSLTRINIMLAVTFVMNYFVFMINLESLLSHTDSDT